MFRSPKKFSSQDLHGLWKDLYLARNKKEYVVKGFIGHELSKLKSLLENNDYYSVALAMKEAIHDSVDSISFFSEDYEKYSYIILNPRIQWTVVMKGGTDIKAKFTKLMFLSSIWLPTATVEQAKKSLIADLTGWVDGLST